MVFRATENAIVSRLPWPEAATMKVCQKQAMRHVLLNGKRIPQGTMGAK